MKKYTILKNKYFRFLFRKVLTVIFFINQDCYHFLFFKFLKSVGVEILEEPRFLHYDLSIDSSDYSQIKIGKNITISKEVILLTHDYSLTTALSTLGFAIERNVGEYSTVNGIEIGNNCFIGTRVLILPGTKIGNGVIIGAGSVVKGTVEDNSIVIGNPIKVIGRTTDYAIKMLKGRDFK